MTQVGVVGFRGRICTPPFSAQDDFDLCGSVPTHTSERCYKRTLRRRSALAITDTELKLMAAAAKIGLRRIPKNG
jgi:hypothetical protein